MIYQINISNSCNRYADPLPHYKNAYPVWKRKSLLIVVAFSTSYGTSTMARVGAFSIYILDMVATEHLFTAYLTKPYGTYKWGTTRLDAYGGPRKLYSKEHKYIRLACRLFYSPHTYKKVKQNNTTFLKPDYLSPRCMETHTSKHNANGMCQGQTQPLLQCI